MIHVALCLRTVHKGSSGNEVSIALDAAKLSHGPCQPYLLGQAFPLQEKPITRRAKTMDFRVLMLMKVVQEVEDAKAVIAPMRVLHVLMCPQVIFRLEGLIAYPTVAVSLPLLMIMELLTRPEIALTTTTAMTMLCTKVSL